MRVCLMILIVSVTLISKSLANYGRGGRVTIEGSGTRFVMRGNNLTVVCRYNRLSVDLHWYNSTKHKVLAKPGSLHITLSQLQHYRSSVSSLDFVNITSSMEGTYTCFGGEGSFDVEIFVFDVIANESHYETNQCNLTCELMGFTHNLPEVRVYWELSTGGLVDTSLPGLKIGISSEKHFTWIDINLIIYAGNIRCIFELPSPEGSFYANGSFVLFRGIMPLERGRGRNTHGTVVFLVASMFVITMVAINLICNYKTSGRLYDRDLVLRGLRLPGLIRV